MYFLNYKDAVVLWVVNSFTPVDAAEILNIFRPV